MGNREEKKLGNSQDSIDINVTALPSRSAASGYSYMLVTQRSLSYEVRDWLLLILVVVSSMVHMCDPGCSEVAPRLVVSVWIPSRLLADTEKVTGLGFIDVPTWKRFFF